jgi:hypothetical protein
MNRFFLILTCALPLLLGGCVHGSGTSAGPGYQYRYSYGGVGVGLPP